MVKVYPFLLFSISALGCAATTGRMSYDTGYDDYSRLAGQPERQPDARATGSGIAGGEVLDRAEYVRAVLQSNPSIESARQSWRAALAHVRQAGSFDDPTVDLGIAPLSIGSHAPVGYEVAVSQHLPWFGKRSLDAAATAGEAEAAKSDYETTKRELALVAVTLYDQYFVAERAIEINQRHVELMRVMRASATAQLETGRGSLQDPLQAEVELARMEHDSAVLSSQRDVTVAQMNELMHRAPELPLPPPAKELALPPALDASAIPYLERVAVGQRSEIAAARHRAEAAQARADRADRDAYPDLTLSTSYDSMWDMPQHRWMVGVGFNVPIQSGRRSGSADESRAVRARFEADARRMTDAARTQVFVAFKKLEAATHSVTVFETRLLPAALNQIDAARAGFTTSQNPFMAVVEAEKNLRTVELDYETARAECDQQRAELDRALGRIPGLETNGVEK